MKKLFGATLLISGLCATAAHAQTQVAVDRESFQGRLQAISMQIQGLLRQVQGQPSVEAQLNALRAQLQGIEQDLNNARPAGAVSVGPPVAPPPPVVVAPPAPPPPQQPPSYTVTHVPPPQDSPAAVVPSVLPSPQVVVVPPPAPPPAPVVVMQSPGMEPSAFENLVSAVAQSPFSSGKQALIRAAAMQNMFSVDQVVRLIQQMQFSGDRFYVIRRLRGRVVDPQNNFRIIDALPFIHEKRRAQRYLGMM